MKPFYLLLTSSLLCLAPCATWAQAAQNHSKPDNASKDERVPEDTDEMAACMKGCQQPLLDCTQKCGEDADCNQRCGDELTRCVKRVCKEVLPK